MQNNVYTCDMTNLGFGAASNNHSDTGSYVIDVATCNANTFTASAAYQNTDAENSKCATFSIDGRGAKSSTPHNDCWTNTRR